MRAASWSSSAMSPTLTGSEAPRLRRALGGTNPLSRYPRAYLFLARRRYGSRVLGPDTDIVIEGFPRSANTFAVTAFELAQERPVTVAHHLHAAAHVVRAAQAGVPVIVLVRAPEDAIASVVARKPSARPGGGRRRIPALLRGRRAAFSTRALSPSSVRSSTTSAGSSSAPTARTGRPSRRSSTPTRTSAAASTASRPRTATGRPAGWSSRRLPARPTSAPGRPRQRAAVSNRSPPMCGPRLGRVYDATVERATP